MTAAAAISPQTGINGVLKRAMDIAIAMTALLVFSPVFIVVPVLIRLEDPGPVFYRQKRYGYNSRLFECLKFRSMYLKDCARDEIRLTERDDPRVMRIGRFIRRTSIDELPQFINVLKGEMSVVGPRPHPPGVKAGGRTYEEVVDDFARRYRVRPGITGWAQVNGLRGNTFTEDDIRRRFEHDMHYIQNWTPFLDIMIVWRTFLMGFTGKNAF